MKGSDILGEGENNVISKDACEQCQKNIFAQLGKLWDKDDGFETTITELKVIGERQLVLQEQNSKMIAKLEDRQNNLEDNYANTLTKLVAQTSATQEKFWKQPWFKYVIITTCIIFVVVVGAAVGVNVIDTWKSAISVK